MADAILVRALKGQPKTLNLCNKHLDRVPKAIGSLEFVCQLNLKNNKIKRLPLEMIRLYQVLIYIASLTRVLFVVFTIDIRVVVDKFIYLKRPCSYCSEYLTVVHTVLDGIDQHICFD